MDQSQMFELYRALMQHQQHNSHTEQTSIQSSQPSTFDATIFDQVAPSSDLLPEQRRGQRPSSALAVPTANSMSSNEQAILDLSISQMMMSSQGRSHTMAAYATQTQTHHSASLPTDQSQRDSPEYLSAAYLMQRLSNSTSQDYESNSLSLNSGMDQQSFYQQGQGFDISSMSRGLGTDYQSNVPFITSNDVLHSDSRTFDHGGNEYQIQRQNSLSVSTMMQRNEKPAAATTRLRRTSSTQVRRSLNEREEFFIFIKILFRYLERDNPWLRPRAKAIVNECTKRNRMGDAEYSPLCQAVEQKLRGHLGDLHWNRAKMYFDHYCQLKGINRAVAVAAV